MKKRIRILTLALAFSLMTSQAAQAALISPLSVGQTGGPEVTENQQSSNGQTGGQTGNASGFPCTRIDNPAIRAETAAQDRVICAARARPFQPRSRLTIIV